MASLKYWNNIDININFVYIKGDEEHENNQILDLSKKNLKKVPKQDDAQNYRTLILDDNELQKIDNIDSYLRIEKVSNEWVSENDCY